MALPNAPQSRNEKYLAKIAGQEVELPNEPLSREEQYLDYIAKNGGGGGGYTLPTATESRLGGIKVGSGLNVEEDGTLSTNGGTSERPIDFDSVVGGGRSTESILYNTFTCSFDDTYRDWSINVLALTGSINLTHVDKIKLSCVSTTFSGEALVRVYLTTVNTYIRGYGTWSNLLSDNNLHAHLEITEDGDYEINTRGITGNRYIYVVALTGLNQGQQGRCDDNKLGAFDGTLNLSMFGVDQLEAGNYIEIDANDKINVKMEKGDTTEYEYRLTGAYSPTNQLTIEKYRDGELISTESYENVSVYTPITIDGLFDIWYGGDGYYWHYKLLEDSQEHSAGYEDSWYYTDTTTHTEIFDIEDSSLTLVRNCDLAPVAKSGNYSDLNDKPSINGVILSGNKTAGDLGLVAAPIVNLNNGMVSHSTDAEYITVDLDTPLTALKQYSVTLKDPSSNYIETLKVLWNGTTELTFPGNASTSGGFGLRLLEETVQLFNYGGMRRDIYCTIEETAEDEHELKTLRLSSGSTDGNGVRGTGLNIEDVVIVGVSSGDSSSDLMWNLGMKNVSGGKHEYTIRFFRPSGELCSNMNFWADVFYYDV